MEIKGRGNNKSIVLKGDTVSVIGAEGQSYLHIQQKSGKHYILSTGSSNYQSIIIKPVSANRIEIELEE